RRRARIEVGRHPVLQDRLEGRGDPLVREHLAVRLAALLPGIVVLPQEEVDAFVVEIEGPEHLVELHHAVEEVPADVPLHRPQEFAHRHMVLAARIVDDTEVRVPLERVLSEAEGLVAEVVRLPRFHQVLRLNDHRHSSVRQISFQAYVTQGLCFVCRSARDFLAAFMRYATRAGRDARLPSRRTIEPISVPLTSLWGPSSIGSRGSRHSIVISPSTNPAY